MTEMLNASLRDAKRRGDPSPRRRIVPLNCRGAMRSLAITIRQWRDRMEVSPEVTRVIRFGLVGAVAFAAYTAIMSVAIYRFGADQVVGALLGFIAGTLVSYFGNTLFSFGVRPTAANSAKFWVVTLVGLVLNLLLAFVCQHLGVPPLATALLIFIIVPALNYLGHRFWTFAGAIPTLEKRP